MNFGLPAYIYSDRGTSFLSKVVGEILLARDIVASSSAPYNPQGNGQVEKLNSTLESRAASATYEKSSY